MKTKIFKIDSIPACLFGENEDNLFIAVHGFFSNKQDKIIREFSNIVTKKGYSVLSFDLASFGERTGEKCTISRAISDLTLVLDYAKREFINVNVFAVSYGAYISMQVFKQKTDKFIMLSPIVNMLKLTYDLMMQNGVTEQELINEKEIVKNYQAFYLEDLKFAQKNPSGEIKGNGYVIYGKNDTLLSFSLIKDFSDKNNCELFVLQNGEHFFHTKEQLDFFKNAINKIV